MKTWMRVYTEKLVDLQTKWMVLQEKLNGENNSQARADVLQTGEGIDDTGGGLEAGEPRSQDPQNGANPQQAY